MNDIATTTTIRDTVSINDNMGTEESFDVSFSQDSSSINGSYSVTNVENYPSIVYFIQNTLSNFDLVNEDEIIDFIIKNIGLINITGKSLHSKETLQWVGLISFINMV